MHAVRYVRISWWIRLASAITPPSPTECRQQGEWTGEWDAIPSSVTASLTTVASLAVNAWHFGISTRRAILPSIHTLFAPGSWFKAFFPLPFLALDEWELRPGKSGAHAGTRGRMGGKPSRHARAPTRLGFGTRPAHRLLPCKACPRVVASTRVTLAPLRLFRIGAVVFRFEIESANKGMIRLVSRALSVVVSRCPVSRVWACVQGVQSR